MSPAKPQQLIASSTTTLSATAAASALIAACSFSRWAEQLWCTATAGTFFTMVSFGSTWASRNSAESATGAVPGCSFMCLAQVEASVTTL